MVKLLRTVFALFVLVIVAACSVPPAPTGSAPQRQPAARAPATDAATRQFVAVAERVEPVATRACQIRRPDSNCAFVILIDERRGQPVNAFQTVGRQGRPFLIFTRGIVEEFRNPDEIAFVIGHEAAHHIEDHLRERAEAAGTFGAILEAAAAAGGVPSIGQASASEIGQAFGARVFSKQFELEADALGTVIAKNAGYNPVRGAQFFNRLPDPGDQFLGSHPPNAERIETVRRVAAGLS